MQQGQTHHSENSLLVGKPACMPQDGYPCIGRETSTPTEIAGQTVWLPLSAQESNEFEGPLPAAWSGMTSLVRLSVRMM